MELMMKDEDKERKETLVLQEDKYASIGMTLLKQNTNFEDGEIIQCLMRSGWGSSLGGMGFTVLHAWRLRGLLTSAEIMWLEMSVMEQSDNRLGKTLLSTLVGQVKTVVNSKSVA